RSLFPTRRETACFQRRLAVLYQPDGWIRDRFRRRLYVTDRVSPGLEAGVAQRGRQRGREQYDVRAQGIQPLQETPEEVLHIEVVGVDLIEDDRLASEREEPKEEMPGVEHAQECLVYRSQPVGCQQAA